MTTKALEKSIKRLVRVRNHHIILQVNMYLHLTSIQLESLSRTIMVTI